MAARWRRDGSAMASRSDNVPGLGSILIRRLLLLHVCRWSILPFLVFVHSLRLAHGVSRSGVACSGIWRAAPGALPCLLVQEATKLVALD